jgi:hypothetical protein
MLILVLCLDLFGLLFIMFKLAILPLILPIQTRFSNKTRKKLRAVKNLKEKSMPINTDRTTHNVAIQTLSEITQDHHRNDNNQTYTHYENWIVQSKV